MDNLCKCSHQIYDPKKKFSEDERFRFQDSPHQDMLMISTNQGAMFNTSRVQFDRNKDTAKHWIFFVVVAKVMGEDVHRDARVKPKGVELEIYGHILTDTVCDCGLRMYQDDREPAPGSKPNRNLGFWCKICDAFGIEDNE